MLAEHINKIMHGHCFEAMAVLPDKSIDMILCDPPYGVTSGRNTWDKVLPVHSSPLRGINKELYVMYGFPFMVSTASV